MHITKHTPKEPQNLTVRRGVNSVNPWAVSVILPSSKHVAASNRSRSVCSPLSSRGRSVVSLQYVFLFIQKTSCTFHVSSSTRRPPFLGHLQQAGDTPVNILFDYVGSVLVCVCMCMWADTTNRTQKRSIPYIWKNTHSILFFITRTSCKQKRLHIHKYGTWLRLLNIWKHY